MNYKSVIRWRQRNNNDERNELANSIRTSEFSARANELNALEKEFGSKVCEIVIQNRTNEVENSWKSIAKSCADTSIQGIINTLWKWVGEAGIKYTIERTDKTAQIKVTYCPIAEMAKKLGQEKWGYNCYCNDDYSIVRGFNDNIKFSRTKTLMEGHDCCNHFYSEE